ncbi:hypothetical protein AY600_02080 [Phormidium willei BDU 130791]|nr:hypothetical protein AY600_02080 [Phormidium willei BDU 130791]
MRKDLTREDLKLGKRNLGTVYRWPDGRSCFLAERRIKDIERGKNAYVSHAKAKEQAMWSIETYTLTKLRTMGIQTVGVRVKDSGDIYLTSYHRMMRDGKVLSARTRNGSLQRSLPIQHFRRKRGRLKL